MKYESLLEILLEIAIGTFRSKIQSSSRRRSLEVFCNKFILKNFAKFKRKNLYRCLFYNKVPG